MALPEISSPAGGVVNAPHLLLEAALGIGHVSQLNIGGAKHPTRVGKVSEGPDPEGSHRQIVILIHRDSGREWKDRAPTFSHHRGCHGASVVECVSSFLMR